MRKTIIAALLAVAATSALADLAPDQIPVLKASIAAETAPQFVSLRNGGATYAMADWYNKSYNPATLAWVTSCAPQAIDEGSVYSSFDSVAAGKRDAWALFLQYAPRDMSKAKNRIVVTDVWGAANSGSVGESILIACTRQITRGENLLGGTTTGTTGAVTARRLTWEGSITNTDIIQALQ